MNLSLRCIFRAAFLSAVIILSGCASRIPLTKSLIREYNLTYNDIKRLQLYISDDLLLEQEAKSVNKDIDHTHSLMKVKTSISSGSILKARRRASRQRPRPTGCRSRSSPQTG